MESRVVYSNEGIAFLIPKGIVQSFALGEVVDLAKLFAPAPLPPITGAVSETLGEPAK